QTERHKLPHKSSFAAKCAMVSLSWRQLWGSVVGAVTFVAARCHRSMSALRGKADINRAVQNVRFSEQSEILIVQANVHLWGCELIRPLQLCVRSTIARILRTASAVDGSCSPPCAVKLKSFSLYLLLSHSIKSRLPFFSESRHSTTLTQPIVPAGRSSTNCLKLANEARP